MYYGRKFLVDKVKNKLKEYEKHRRYNIRKL